MLLVAALLASIALFPAAARPLAVLALLAVAIPLLAGAPPLAGALGPLAPALALTLETAVATAAVAVLGGLAGPLVALPPALVAVARLTAGAPASRFAAAVSTAGLAALLFVAPTTEPRTAVRVFLPLAVLAVLEIGHASARSTGEPVVPGTGTARGAAPPSRPARDLKAEILHDLRSPLSAIRVYTDLIGDRVRKGEPPADEHVRNLASEVELMELLVEARAGAPARSVDLVAMLRDLVATYRTAGGDRHRLEFVGEVARAPVAADVVTLHRVFRNVLDNAVQYTPPEGQITVRVGALGGNALVRIRDTGAGMTAEERGRAFELSYRGAGARAARAGGSGIGLAVARDLVLARGGDIALESEAGRGSEVRIMFPLAVEEGA